MSRHDCHFISLAIAMGSRSFRKVCTFYVGLYNTRTSLVCIELYQVIYIHSAVDKIMVCKDSLWD